MRKKVAFQVMLLLAIFSFTFIVSAPGKASAKEITVGILNDLTGPIGYCGTPDTWGLQDYLKYANERNEVPGVTFSDVVYDTKYDAAKTAAAYQYCKSKGAVVISPMVLHDAEALKPMAAEDHIPVVGYNGSNVTCMLPSWVFSTEMTTDDAADAMLRYLVSGWDYQEKKRPPNIAFIGWDNALGNTYVRASENLVTSPEMKGKVNFVGSIIVPPRTLDYTDSAMRFSNWKTDWVGAGFVPTGTIPLMKLARENNYGYKLIWAVWGDAMWGFAKERAGAALEGNLYMSSFGLFEDTGPEYWGVELAEQLLKKYRDPSDVKKYKMLDGHEYFMGMARAMAIVQAAKQAAYYVGPENVDGSAIYEQLQNLNFSAGNIMAQIHWTKGKRASANCVRVLECDAKGNRMPITDWYEIGK